jgi:hypothetical protein
LYFLFLHADGEGVDDMATGFEASDWILCSLFTIVRWSNIDFATFKNQMLSEPIKSLERIGVWIC